MDSIFGIPMDGILVVLLGIMGICLLAVGAIAIFNRVIFKMALRNPRRRKTQSILIVVGLMLATLITATALTTGDSLDYSIKRTGYEAYGQIDEMVVFSTSGDEEARYSLTSQPIPAAVVDDLEAELANAPEIEAFLPVLNLQVPALNRAAGLSEPVVELTGVDLSRLDDFGGIPGSDGVVDPAVLESGNAVVSKSLADELNIQPGEILTVYLNNQPFEVPVGAIGADSVLTGVPYGIALPLDRVQEMSGMEGMARFIGVSNVGGVDSGVEHTDSAVASLNDVIAGEQLGVVPIKQDVIEQSEAISGMFTGMFLVMGLFSIAAGVLLIFLIFMMLASERRSEMGMARAVGMRQSSLVQQFLAEGTLYDLGAALVGAMSGIGVAYLMLLAMERIFATDEGVNFTFTTSWRSLAVAYALGVTVTFLTLIFASGRAARLNIVSAIRDLPESEGSRERRPRWRWWVKLPRFGLQVGRVSLSNLILVPIELIPNLVLLPVRLLSWLVRLLAYYIGWGPLLTPLGALMMLGGWSLSGSGGSMALYSTGLSVCAVGVMLILRRWLPDRLVFTVGSALLLTWWLAPAGTFVEDIVDAVTPENLQGDFDMFFISGIMMVTFAVLLVMWNAEVIVSIIGLFGKLFQRWVPAVKTAVAYPLASKTKTGLTLAMFALIVFSLVTMSTLNANFIEIFSSSEATGGWDVRVTTSATNPVGDLDEALASSEVDTQNFAAIGTVANIDWGNANFRLADTSEDGNWKLNELQGVDAAFVANAEMPLAARAPGYNSDAEAWQAILDDPSLAMIDGISATGDTGPGAEADWFTLNGFDAENFQPVTIEIQDPESGNVREVTIIGVVEDTVTMIEGVYVDQSVVEEMFGAPSYDMRYVKLNDDSLDTSVTTAKAIESTLVERGVQAESMEEEVRDMASENLAIMNILQGFMGLGLLVGIAALGVISFRAVVERRQQIGMLRAIGFQKNMVAASFLIESLVVAVLGVLAGIGLALTLSYNLLMSGQISENTNIETFLIPWNVIGIMTLIALGAAMVMTFIPSRHAASVPVADALRYE